MDAETVAAQMAGDARIVETLLAGVTAEQARWKPDPDAWSILEVLNHLYDEELEDFRAHLDLILHRPDDPWSGIDPEGWVKERRYNERDLAESLDNFLCARRESLAWLAGLDGPDWQTAYKAPFGEITAGDMVASWLAHDLLHLRQLVELRWAYTTTRLLQPYNVRYAGVW